jgi:hypothetical protein
MTAQSRPSKRKFLNFKPEIQVSKRKEFGSQAFWLTVKAQRPAAD